ncbi:MAG: hypothetical protein FWF43_04685 [Propionibacteriaceae bacterium]|nr:hypothetical protein [Propionibacteriaceae bacterium]
MGRSVPEATIAIGRVRSMPFGRSRAEAAARQVRLIEAEGPDEVRAYALESLVEALTWSGESSQAVVPFIKLLRWWDVHPEHFDVGDQNILFWEFGWIVNDLCRNPDVPVERVERTLNDMERRFSLANRGMERVWSCRLEWELLRGGPQLEKTFTTWLTMPVDDEDSCPACHQEHHADYLIQIGDMEGAAAILQAAVASELTCSREPASMLSMLAWCYVEMGREEEAEAILPHTVAEMKAATSLSVLVAYARLFEVFARGDVVAMALDLVDKIVEGLATASPYARLETLRHLVAGTTCLVARGHGAQLVKQAESGLTVADSAPTLTDPAPTLADPGPVVAQPELADAEPGPTIAELAADVTAQASALTETFDRRHSTDVQAARLAQVMATQPTARPLVFVTKEIVPVSSDESAVPAETFEEPVNTMRVQAEHAFQAGDHAVAATLFRLAAAEAQSDGWLDSAGWCWAEAARNCQEIGQFREATHDYVEAQALLHASGVTLEEITPMFVAWAPMVRKHDYDTFVRLAEVDYPTPARPPGVEKMEEIMPAIFEASLLGSPLLRRYILSRALLRDALARVMATWGDTKDKELALKMAEESATRFSILGRTEDAAHAWWLAGNVAAQLSDKSADTNFAMAVQGFVSSGRRNRRFSTLASGDYATYLRSAGRTLESSDNITSWEDKDS